MTEPIATPSSPSDATSPEIRELAKRVEKLVRPNIVQSIRAYHPADLQAVAACLGQHFLYADLAEATTKQRILEEIGRQFMLPAYFGRNLDALYDCLTDTILHAGAQPGFIVVLEHIPISIKFDKEMREQLVDVFRDAADFWAERKTPFRCFYSFY
ncbi:barnase inhibitor [Corticibacter populi]|uniref:Barnase inhibitor n=1 Tax=Corticibacter populi TaxID=1550736 RepID=A0A3M6QM93_9BURK|nr:barstar family protein [Corticibacter populi]RMX04200.1 barnase inhibitor [Corticibacter populi]RZS33227.1 RNAse (barnase) inhibitor barstar [Corticibacter populi]